MPSARAVARRRLGGAEFLAWALERITVGAQHEALQRFAVIVLVKIRAERLLAHDDIVMREAFLYFCHVSEKSLQVFAARSRRTEPLSEGSLDFLAMLDHRG